MKYVGLLLLVCVPVTTMSCSRSGLRLAVGNPQSFAINGGEKKELLVFVPPGSVARVTATQHETDIQLIAGDTRIDREQFGHEVAYVEGTGQDMTVSVIADAVGQPSKGTTRISVDWIRTSRTTDKAALQAQQFEVKGRQVLLDRNPGTLAEGGWLLKQALELWRQSGDGYSEAMCRMRFGQVLEHQSRFIEANREYERALPLLETDRSAWLDARKSWMNLGGQLGETRADVRSLRGLLTGWEAVGDRRGVAALLGSIGNRCNGDTERDMRCALESRVRAIAVDRALGNRSEECRHRLSLAGFLIDSGKVSDAVSAFEQAAEVASKLPDPRLEMEVLGTGTHLYGLAGAPAKQLPLLNRLRKIHEQRGDLSAWINATEHLALTEATIGESDLAWKHLREARTKRSEMSFANRNGNPHAKFGNDGWSTEIIAYHLPHLDSRSSFWFVDSARGFFVADDFGNRVAELQSALDDDSLVLEYVVPGEHEHPLVIWAVSRTAVRTYRVSHGAAVAARAHRVAEDWSRPAKVRQGADDDRMRLARDLFQPLADFPKTRKIIIVQDERIYRVPFSALPSPMHDSGKIGNHYEVIVTPSAMGTVASRSMAGKSKAYSAAFGVVTDPVVNRYDSRMRHAGPVPRPAAVAENVDWMASTRTAGLFKDGIGFPRLAHAAEERKGLRATALKIAVEDVAGFDATRERVTSLVRQSRFVHFATHGVADLNNPGRSGLALSFWDAKGVPIEGFWRFDEIATPKSSNAELITLGACETSIGRHAGGKQGVPSLSHAFLRAGAKRVVSTLWKVDDAASSALMVEFYRILFVESEKRPAVALWRAQQFVAKHPKWAHPYYWAGFQLMGDWGSL